MAKPYCTLLSQSGERISPFVTRHLDEICGGLQSSGAVLIRGFNVSGVEDFGAVMDALRLPRIEYTYRSTPRTEISNKLYTATEYPRQLQIPLHNENSYQLSWPLKIGFCCVRPARRGGATPIIRMDRVRENLGEAIFDEFKTRKLKYIRHFRPYVDIPWQVAFQCSTREGVEQYCVAHKIAFEWVSQDLLRTTQTCDAVRTHPDTGSEVFFNQAHVFHVTSLGREGAEAALAVFGKNGLPRHCQFADGDEIDDKVIERAGRAFRDGAVDIEWMAGDILLLDNMQFAHGRRSYEGDRNVLVAMSGLGGETAADVGISSR